MTETIQFGKLSIDDEGPVNPAPGVWKIPGFGNTGVVQTDDGLVVIDMPVRSFLKNTMTELRRISKDPIHTVFVTHGHLDHAVHLKHLFKEAAANSNPPPRVIAHRNVLKRFAKYRMLATYHEQINRIQFNVAQHQQAFPLPEYNPDVVFDQSFSTTVGGIDFHAFHGLGETDDHLWLWVPEKETVFAGDFVVYSFPNVGNPFKVQRYALEWAEALDAIVAKNPRVLVPGHGPVIEGRKNVRTVCLKISEALRYLHREVIERLNAGMPYEDIVHDVKLPEHMLDNKFLAPRYGCPTFVVHGILRQYTGWYDGNPSNLFPPKKSDLAREVAKLVGVQRIMEHAFRLAEKDQAAMALQFVDMALSADIGNDQQRRMHLLKSQLLEAMGRKADSFIAKSIFYRARDLEKQATKAPDQD